MIIITMIIIVLIILILTTAGREEVSAAYFHRNTIPADVQHKIDALRASQPQAASLAISSLFPTGTTLSGHVHDDRAGGAQRNAAITARDSEPYPSSAPSLPTPQQTAARSPQRPRGADATRGADAKQGLSVRAEGAAAWSPAAKPPHEAAGTGGSRAPLKGQKPRPVLTLPYAVSALRKEAGTGGRGNGGRDNGATALATLSLSARVYLRLCLPLPPELAAALLQVYAHAHTHTHTHTHMYTLPPDLAAALLVVSVHCGGVCVLLHVCGCVFRWLFIL